MSYVTAGQHYATSFLRHAYVTGSKALRYGAGVAIVNSFTHEVPDAGMFGLISCVLCMHVLRVCFDEK